MDDKIRLTINVATNDNETTCIMVEFWNEIDAPEALKIALAESEKIYGREAGVSIDGKTRDDAGYLDPGHIIVYKKKNQY